MKNKLIIAIGSVSVLVLGSLFYLYLTFLNGIDFSKYIPSNSVVVMKVNLLSIGKKVNFTDASQSNGFKNEILKNLSPSQKIMMEEISNNPSKSGIKFASKPTLFVYNSSTTESEPVVAFMFGISDKEDFKTFISQVSMDLKVDDVDPDGFYRVKMNNSEQFVIYFNDKMGLMISDVDRKELPFKQIRDSIFSMNKDNSILSNEDYVAVNKQSSDMMLYFNAKELLNAVSINNYSAEVNRIKKSVNAIPHGLTLNFNEDEVAIKMIGNKSKENGFGSFYKEEEFTDSELKNIDPNGSPLAYLTMNVDFKKALELLIEQTANRGYSDLDVQINNLARKLGIPKDDLMNLIGGKLSLSFSGMQHGNRSYGNPTKPIINGWIQLGNKNAAQKLLDLATIQGGLVNDDGIYAEKTNLREPAIFMTIIDKDLFISTQKQPLVNKMQGANWIELADDYGKKDVLANSTALYMDLRYSSYKEMLKKEMNPYDFSTMDKFENILSAFKSISITGKQNEAEISIKFSQKNTNSLQRIVELLQEAYQIAS
jgi:hypothetical protein